jgi:ABC-type branched-subunit amino acid transport system substrate-binding protein
VSELERGADSPALFDAQQADAVRLYASALTKAGIPRPDGSFVVGRESLRDALANAEFEGETGRITFDHAGERQRDIGAALYYVAGGQLTPLRLLQR